MIPTSFPGPCVDPGGEALELLGEHRIFTKPFRPQGRVAAIHGQVGTSDERRISAAQKGDGRRNFCWLTQSPEQMELAPDWLPLLTVPSRRFGDLWTKIQTEHQTNQRMNWQKNKKREQDFRKELVGLAGNLALWPVVGCPNRKSQPNSSRFNARCYWRYNRSFANTLIYTQILQIYSLWPVLCSNVPRACW